MNLSTGQFYFYAKHQECGNFVFDLKYKIKLHTASSTTHRLPTCFFKIWTRKRQILKEVVKRLTLTYLIFSLISSWSTPSKKWLLIMKNGSETIKNWNCSQLSRNKNGRQYWIWLKIVNTLKIISIKKMENLYCTTLR